MKKKSSQLPVPGTQFCLYLWDIFPLFRFKKKKIQTTDCMTAGIFFFFFLNLPPFGMGVTVQHLKECITHTPALWEEG